MLVFLSAIHVFLVEKSKDYIGLNCERILNEKNIQYFLQSWKMWIRRQSKGSCPIKIRRFSGRRKEEVGEGKGRWL